MNIYYINNKKIVEITQNEISTLNYDELLKLDKATLSLEKIEALQANENIGYWEWEMGQSSKYYNFTLQDKYEPNNAEFYETITIYCETK